MDDEASKWHYFILVTWPDDVISLEFRGTHRPDFPLSNFKKEGILVLSSLSSFRSGLCTKDSKILMQPIAVIPDPRAAQSLRFSRFARTVDGYHRVNFAAARAACVSTWLGEHLLSLHNPVARAARSQRKSFNRGVSTSIIKAQYFARLPRGTLAYFMLKSLSWHTLGLNQKW